MRRIWWFTVRHLPPVLFSALVFSGAAWWTGEPNHHPTVLATLIAVGGGVMWFAAADRSEFAQKRPLPAPPEETQV